MPAGRFRMGCLSGRNCSNNELPVHEVSVGSFALSQYEVTFEEYDRFARDTGRRRPDDHGWGRGRRPVIDVSWDDAVTFAAWLSEETGARYRLPSEAEWEYAARAGTTTPYSWGQEILSTVTESVACPRPPVVKARDRAPRSRGSTGSGPHRPWTHPPRPSSGSGRGPRPSLFSTACF